MSELPINRATGNKVDEVAAAYRLYQQGGGDMVFKQWHDSLLCPTHAACTSCYNDVATR